ncbi:MAG: DNA-binding protein [Reyranella sp.]|nr:DNA-binding protein [Reyranella sp.]
MQSRLLHEVDGQRTFALVFDTGDEVMASLKEFAARERLSAAQFSAIGAFRSAVLGYFDWETKTYLKRAVDEQVEVASLTGDVALDGKAPDSRAPAIHIHAVLGRRDASALAGHLLEAHVRPTLEVVLVESPAHLCKRHDADSGLALIDVSS